MFSDANHELRHQRRICETPLHSDAGLNAVAKPAKWEPAPLKAMLGEVVEWTGIAGMAPAEIEFKAD